MKLSSHVGVLGDVLLFSGAISAYLQFGYQLFEFSPLKYASTYIEYDSSVKNIVLGVKYKQKKSPLKTVE